MQLLENPEKFKDPKSAKKALDTLLKNNTPVGLQVGVFNLTYFPDDYRFHFNAHNLVVYGKDEDTYLISDPVMESVTFPIIFVTCPNKGAEKSIRKSR